MLTVTAHSGTVRAGPGKTYSIVGKVAQAEQYEVMEERGGWYKIYLEGGTTGWVAGEGVALDQTPRGFTSISSSRSDAVQRRFALVIGNTAYLNNPLRNPSNDATDMAAMLRQLGFDVTLLLDANHRMMDDAIRKFTTGIPQGSAGLFYFSGHGMQIAGRITSSRLGRCTMGPVISNTAQ